MPCGKKKPTPGDRMRYTPHTDAQLARKAELFGEATRMAEQLTVEAGRRGAAWDPSVDLMLAQLNDGMADEEREAAVPTPKIKGTTLKFRCVARAAVTAERQEIGRTVASLGIPTEGVATELDAAILDANGLLNPKLSLLRERRDWPRWAPPEADVRAWEREFAAAVAPDSLLRQTPHRAEIGSPACLIWSTAPSGDLP